MGSGVTLQVLSPPAEYLKPSAWVDFDHPDVQGHLAAHPWEGRSEEAVIRADFEFVRDQVAHSWDIQSRRVTGRASDVLRHREGICYAKSHLLAALLRGRGIPAGLCYQRLTLGDTPDTGHCVHALNAVWRSPRGRHGFGWTRAATSPAWTRSSPWMTSGWRSPCARTAAR